MLFKSKQLSKAFSLISVTLKGILIFFNLGDPPKAKPSNLGGVPLIVTLVNLGQSLNIEYPILEQFTVAVTNSGQKRQVQSPRLVTLEGMVMLVKKERLKASLPIEVTLFGIRT